MKKQSLIYYLAISTFTLFAIGIPFSWAYIPDEWIVATDYDINGSGELLSGDLEDTYTANNQWMVFRSHSVKGSVDFDFGNPHAKKLKVKVACIGGLWPEIDIWVYYTSGNPLHINNVPWNVVKTYSLDANRRVDYVDVDFTAGFWAQSGDYKVDYLSLLFTFR